jgi:hypothetical protein
MAFPAHGRQSQAGKVRADGLIRAPEKRVRRAWALPLQSRIRHQQDAFHPFHKEISMYWLPLVMALALTAPSAPPQKKLGEAPRPTAPESFSINANATGAGGAVAGMITVKMDKYSTDADRKTVEDALRQGNPAFLAALRQAPVVGTLSLAGQTFDIRWAREERAGNARTIVLVTDRPVFFVGGGAVTAKPREGYDVALLKFKMDDSGIGYGGVMAAAARVKVGPGGIEVDDYGEKPLELRSVTRAIK